jgi:hypothetical protein
MRIFSPVALTAILSVIEPSGLYRSCCILGNCLLCCLRAEGWWDTSTGGSANSLAEAAPRCLSSYSVAFPCHWPLKRARVVLRALAPCRSAATAHRGESPSRRRARSATRSCRLHGSAPAYEQRSRIIVRSPNGCNQRLATFRKLHCPIFSRVCCIALFDQLQP